MYVCVCVLNDMIADNADYTKAVYRYVCICVCMYI